MAGAFKVFGQVVNVPKPNDATRLASRGRASIALSDTGTTRVLNDVDVRKTAASLLEFYQNGTGNQLAVSRSTPNDVSWEVVSTAQDAQFISYLVNSKGLTAQQANQIVNATNIVIVKNQALGNGFNEDGR